MEAHFQYKRIERAAMQELANGQPQCSCSGSEGQSCECKGQPTDPSISSQQTDLAWIVQWANPNDPLNPANWSMLQKTSVTFLVSLIGVSVTAASAIDALGVTQYTEEFHTSRTVGSIPTGIFMIGIAFGSLLSGPFSETFGRNGTYLVTMTLYLLFIMASALAPNLASHLVFRFLAGFFGSTPLICCGGTIADLWDPLHKVYAFLIYAIPGFGGPVVGQLIGSFIPPTLGWRWLEWIMLIMGGTVLVLVLLLQPETYGNLLLYWKASVLRKKTGDSRYRAPMEMRTSSLRDRLVIALSRPFLWSYTELIVMLFSLYLTIVYIILFTFLEGYHYIFGEIYGLSPGLVGISWAAMLVGMLFIWITATVVYSWTAKELNLTSRIRPETRLWYAMLGGAPALPIGLFWMGWTARASISIWSPLVASAFVGYGMVSIFVSAYLYIIDSYGEHAASALGFMGFSRYLISGGTMIAGVTIYEKYGVAYTLTVLGAISAAMAAVPYAFYIYGPWIRKNSKHTIARE